MAFSFSKTQRKKEYLKTALAMEKGETYFRGICDNLKDARVRSYPELEMFEPTKEERDYLWWWDKNDIDVRIVLFFVRWA